MRAKREAARNDAPADTQPGVGGEDRVPAIIVALLNTMADAPLQEVLVRLSRRLNAAPDARARRARELALLHPLMEEAESSAIAGDVPYVSREYYDARRDQLDVAGRPLSSSALVVRYGSWMNACLAAASIDADGTFLGPWNAWRSGMEGRDRYRVSPAAAQDAVRQCATETGIRRPTSDQYNGWRNARAALLRSRGLTPTLPAQRTVYRLLGDPEAPRGHRWQGILRRVFDQ